MNGSIEVTGNVMEKLADYPEAIMLAIGRGQTLGTNEAVAQIIPSRLTGKGPFPVEEHRLGRVTHDYATTTVAVPAIIEGNTSTTAIGASVPYLFAHEFGVTGEQTVRAHIRRRFSGSTRGPLGFKRRKATGGSLIASYKRVMNLPARAPIQTGIEENMPVIIQRINEAAALDWNTP